jgi:hypothetical protein
LTRTAVITHHSLASLPLSRAAIIFKLFLASFLIICLWIVEKVSHNQNLLLCGNALVSEVGIYLCFWLPADQNLIPSIEISIWTHFIFFWVLVQHMYLLWNAPVSLVCNTNKLEQPSLWYTKQSLFCKVFVLSNKTKKYRWTSIWTAQISPDDFSFKNTINSSFPR